MVKEDTPIIGVMAVEAVMAMEAVATIDFLSHLQ
jgi:hypothetical protein